MQEVYVEKSGIRKKDSGNGLFIKKKVSVEIRDRFFRRCLALWGLYPQAKL